MATRMQQRRGSAAQWTAANPVLAAGEIGFETDTNKFKMGNGTSTWSQLVYFANATELTAAINSVIGMAPETLNTLSEISDSLGDDPNFLSALATNSKVDTLHLQTAASITSASNGVITSLETHAGKTTSVHGIADTSLLATTANVATAKSEAIANAQTKAENAVIEASAAADVKVAAAVAALTASSVGLGNVSNTTDLAKPVSLATEAAIDAALTEAKSDSATKVSDHTSITTGIHGIADTAALATKVYADNAVSTHQSDTTNVHGIADTSLLALKSEVAAVTKSTLGLTSVDNTADTAKPVSTAQAAAIASAKSEAITSAATATDTKISDHNIDTTNVHGISDTSVLVTQTDLTNAVNGATVDQSALAGVGIDYNAVTDAFDLDNTYITTATQTALDLKAPKADPTFTGTVSGVTKAHVGLGNVDNTSDANKPVSTAQQTALNAKLALAGGTMTGALTLSGAPTSDLHAATKSYVDGLAAGINFHQPVKVATNVNLATVYNNGTNGLGATLTADTNRAITTIDGISIVVGDRILVKDQTTATQNGIYTLTTVGSGSTPYVLTRATDSDNNPSGELSTGDFCFVTSGTGNAAKGFILSTTGAITLGTTNVNYAQFNASEAVTAGTNITKTGATIAVADAPTFSGAVTASSGIVFSDGTQTKVGVPSITTFATAISSSATLAAGEADKFVPLTGSVTITLPATGYSTGQSIDFYQASGTGAQFASTNSVVGTPGLKFRTTNSVATAMKTSAGWLVFGDLSA